MNPRKMPDRMAVQNAYKQVPQQVEYILGHCDGREIAVQAGGWKGAAPVLLSKSFDLVYTYEPDITNYSELVKGVADRNIIPQFGFLYNEHGTCGITHNPKNSADCRSKPGGNIPRHTIDDLDLPACDVIWLDIQGDEYEALQGAALTIAKYQPLIGCEISSKCPTTHDIGSLLRSFGYQGIGAVHLDHFYKVGGNNA